METLATAPLSYLPPTAELLPEAAKRSLLDYTLFLMERNHIQWELPTSQAHPYAGCMKGTVLYMSDDFNEPLDDFKDYM
jgi:hypothetical protein